MKFHTTNPFSRKTAEAQQGPAPAQPTKPGSDEKAHSAAIPADEPPPYSASNVNESRTGAPQTSSTAQTARPAPSPVPQSQPQAGPQQQSQPHQPQPQPRYFFPPEWQLYGSPFDTTMMLGPHPDRPLYAISQHSGWSGNPDVILHCGPAISMPALASAATNFTFGNSGPNQIVLPALDPFAAAAAAAGHPGVMNGGGMSVVTEMLEPAGGWTANMLFSIEVGQPPSVPGLAPPRREMFEWRHTRGDAVADLGVAGYGYKLVRLSSDPPPGIPAGSAQFVGGGHATSTGQEVVAVFARARALGWGGAGERMRFRYLGTGASGLLGERWALMAAITAIRLWQREQRQRR